MLRVKCIVLLVVGMVGVARGQSGCLYPQDSEFRETKLLDGVWSFRIAPRTDPELGFREKWFSQPLAQTGDVLPMPVPSSYNDITQNATIRDHVGWVWYDTRFYAPQRWNGSEQNVFLRFGSVHYVAVVWLNGEQVLKHVGGHLPFQAVVTKLLKYSSDNLLTVAVNNTLTPETIPQGQINFEDDSSRYPPGYFTQTYTFDFFNYAGIHRHVTLFTTPQVFIDDITVVTDVDDDQPNSGILQYNVAVSPSSTATYVKCEVRLLDQLGSVVANGGDLKGTLVVPSATLWWPYTMSSNPGYLYTLEVKIKASDDKQDAYRLKVGIRRVSWNSTSIMINGKPLYIRGLGKHEDSNIRGKGLDYSLIVKDFNLLKWLGANAFRTSHYPYAEEIMDRADAEGVLVIDESPAVDLVNFDAELMNRHMDVMEALIRRDKNRPSVIMWSLANEPRTQKLASGLYFKQVAERTRSLDPTRPVTFVTNQDVDKDNAVQYMDVVCVNRYFGWYQDTGHLEVVADQIVHLFDRWHARYSKPILISEYGADTVAGLHSDPPAVFTEDYQAALLMESFKAFDVLRQRGFFVGEMIWNFADFMTAQNVKRVNGNKKGVFTRERHPKLAAHVLRRRYWKLAQLLDGFVDVPGDVERLCPPFVVK